jgi:hypothetical protein
MTGFLFVVQAPMFGFVLAQTHQCHMFVLHADAILLSISSTTNHLRCWIQPRSQAVRPNHAHCYGITRHTTLGGMLRLQPVHARICICGPAGPLVSEDSPFLLTVHDYSHGSLKTCMCRLRSAT